MDAFYSCLKSFILFLVLDILSKILILSVFIFRKRKSYPYRRLCRKMEVFKKMVRFNSIHFGKNLKMINARLMTRFRRRSSYFLLSACLLSVQVIPK